MQLSVKLMDKKYIIDIKKHNLEKIETFCHNYNKILLVTDDGVPRKYIDMILQKLPQSVECVLKKGERNKNYKSIKIIIDSLIHHHFSRSDLILAVGGGVVIDLSAFAASIYKRGMKYMSIPTTLLSQVDSCVGGKTGMDYGDFKNLIGTFYQPEKVIIDPLTLNTLPKRHFNNGLIEAIKTGLIADEALFNLIMNGDIKKNIDQIIYLSLKNKIKLVETDPFDCDQRQKLNYGHTIGHALESYFHFQKILHGEAVAYGMLYETKNQDIKNQLIQLYQKIKLKKIPNVSIKDIQKYIFLDKKVNHNEIVLPRVNKIGSCELQKVSMVQWLKQIEGENDE